MGQPGQAPGAGASPLVGTWAGTNTATSGRMEIAERFNPDGTFFSVGRLQNGFIARVWGSYRVSATGPNQFRIETQLQGWLPKETCQQMQGGAPQCQPLQLPPTDTATLTFTSPNEVQIVSQTVAGSYTVEHRENQPVLLQVQAPERWTTVIQASPGGGGGYTPSVTPYVTPGRRPAPATNIPGLGGNCDDLQQQRICMDGMLYRGRDGCLHCSR